MSPAVLSVLLAFCSVLLVGQRAVWAKPFDSDVKICNQVIIMFDSLEANFSLEALRTKLRKHVDGCQFVNGDVEIRNFNADPNTGRPLDESASKIGTDFLDSIEEVAGYLYIYQVNIDVLTFKNLRVIRGVNFRSNDRFYAMDVLRNPFLLSLELPKLTAITGGNVRLIGGMQWNLHHFLTEKVNWDLLFRASIRGSDQKLELFDEAMTVGEKDDNATRCHSGCGANCWSSSSNGCQMHDHQCKADVNCSACYSISATDRTKNSCCHASCLGGCSGPGPNACHSCRRFNRDGSCDDVCDVSGMLELRKLANHLCVRKCPLPFLLSFVRNSCDAQCSESEKPVYGACGGCETCRTCEARRIIFTVSDADKFRNHSCNQLSTKSSLDIGPVGYSSRNDNAYYLASLERLEIFYGRLTVRRVELMGVDNVGFLRNLEFVSDGLAIMIAKVRYLGLARLQYVHRLLLFRLSGLCRAWYPAKHIAKMSRLFKVSLRTVTFDDSSNECKNATCDSQCKTRECWGPGPDMCVRDNLWTPYNTLF